MKLYDEYGNELRLEDVLGISEFSWASYNEGKVEGIERRVDSLSAVVVNLLLLLQTKDIQLTCKDINFLSGGTSGYQTVERIDV